MPSPSDRVPPAAAVAVSAIVLLAASVPLIVAAILDASLTFPLGFLVGVATLYTLLMIVNFGSPSDDND